MFSHLDETAVCPVPSGATYIIFRYRATNSTLLFTTESTCHCWGVATPRKCQNDARAAGVVTEVEVACAALGLRTFCRAVTANRRRNNESETISSRATALLRASYSDAAKHNLPSRFLTACFELLCISVFAAYSNSKITFAACKFFGLAVFK